MSHIKTFQAQCLFSITESIYIFISTFQNKSLKKEDFNFNLENKMLNNKVPSKEKTLWISLGEDTFERVQHLSGVWSVK